MQKRIKHKKEFADPQQEKAGWAGMLNKIQEQLVLLERKIDTLISSFSSRPAEAKHFQKPFQQHGYSRNNSQVRQDGSYRERVLHKAVCADCRKECEVPFKPSGGRPVYCKECFSKRKAGDSFKERPDNRPREEAHVQERCFGKKQRGEHRGYSGKKKTNFRKRRSK